MHTPKPGAQRTMVAVAALVVALRSRWSCARVPNTSVRIN
jgi:hypothetical protein